MRTEIEIAKVSVGQLINIYKGHSTEGNSAEFKIVIYRDQSDGDKIIEQFPSGSKFTRKYNTIEHFLNNILVNGGGDTPEAVLDGLATATTNCDWTSSESVKNHMITSLITDLIALGVIEETAVVVSMGLCVILIGKEMSGRECTNSILSISA